MNDPVEFTTEDGMHVRMTTDEHGHISTCLRMDDGREVIFYLTAAEAQTWINGLFVANNNQHVVGEWGWHHNRPVHIPSYNQGHADATGGVA